MGFIRFLKKKIYWNLLGAKVLSITLCVCVYVWGTEQNIMVRCTREDIMLL